MDVDIKPEPGNQPVSSTPFSASRNALSHINVNVESNMMISGTDDDESKLAMSVDSGHAAFLPLTEAHLRVHSAHQNLIDEMEVRKRASTIAVPTNDDLVKARLIELEEPIIMFGETKPARRQRLRLVLAQRGLTQGMPAEVLAVGGVVMDTDSKATQHRPFTTQGLPELAAARRSILQYSIVSSSNRLKRLQERYNSMSKLDDKEWEDLQTKETKSLYEPLSTLLPSISVVGDPRPLTSIAFNHDGSLLATASWNPACKIWDAKTGTEVATLKGHTERVIDVSFTIKPASSYEAVCLASGGLDNTIRLWNGSGINLATLYGHENRVNIIGWHPSSQWLFASSHDCTWSLWDVDTQKQLLKQDGHSRSVFGLSVHPDGALVATGSEDASVKVWDVRSGECLQSFQGHVRQVFGVDWHPDGVILVSASDDHTARIWDMRMKKSVYTISAHTALISDVKFEPSHGKYLVTSGFDKLAKVWKTSDWTCLCSLSGHDSRVTALDISPAQSIINTGGADSICIATAGYDRTWKLWTPS